jgi:hypothetical protein
LEISDEIHLKIEDTEDYLKELETDGFIKNIGNLSCHPVYAIQFEV